MAGIAAALGADAAPVTIDWSGGTVTLGKVEITKVIDALDEFLSERERRRLSASWAFYVEQGKMTADEMFARSDAFVEECVNSGRYGFGSRRMMRIFNAAMTGGGVPIVEFGYFLALMMGFVPGAKENVITPDDAIAIYAEKKQEIHEKLLKILKTSLPTPDEVEAAPKSEGLSGVPTAQQVPVPMEFTPAPLKLPA